MLHHLYGTGAASPAAREPSPIDYWTTPRTISVGTPRVISAPVHGDNWIALNGCCEPGFPHRSSMLPLDGKLNNSQRFAIDWMRTTERGEFFGPSLLGADALPYVIDRFSYVGQVVPEQMMTADDYLTGTYLQGRLPASQPREQRLPLNLAIVDFPTD